MPVRVGDGELTMTEIELIKINLAEFANLFRMSPEKLSDQELLAMDFILHRAWKYKREGHRVFFNDTTWTYDDLMELHAEVKGEMSNRAFKHMLHDELDDQSERLAKEQADVIYELDDPHDFVKMSDPEEFPNLVLREEDAVKFFSKGG